MLGKFAKSRTIKDFVEKSITEGKYFSDFIQVTSNRMFRNLRKSAEKELDLDGDCSFS